MTAESKSQAPEERTVVPVVEEHATVDKQRQVTGTVRVSTRVHEDVQLIDEELTAEEVDVERVTLDQWVDAPVPVRQEGDTTIVTLHQEVPVVEMRLKAIEEVRITRRQTSRRYQDQVSVRRDEVEVERLPPSPGEAGGRR